jgi:transcriptional regulator with XRE-family HTH domain
MMPLVRLMLGRRLRSARASLGFDVDAFAEELGLSPETYKRIEEGKVAPDLKTLVLAAKITGKSLDFLLTGRQFNDAV